MTPQQKTILKVFVSSTWLDLQAERKAVVGVINQLDETKFVGMEYFGSRDDDTQATSIDEVSHCDLYVGIIARRYGSGITYAEYVRARSASLPCLVYIKEDDPEGTHREEGDPDKIRLLNEFKAEVRAHHTVRTFKEPNELAARLAADLHHWIFERWFGGDGLIVRDAYINPQPVFERLQLQRFTGREWLIAKIDQFLKGENGYLVIEAAAGLGKTALLAYLVRERGYFHHFGELTRGRDGAERAVKSLAAQLVQAWGIDPLPLYRNLDSAESREDCLKDLFFEAARARDGMMPDQKIIVLIDGLEEMQSGGVADALGLPAAVPNGVYVILSQRSGSVPPSVDRKSVIR